MSVKFFTLQEVYDAFGGQNKLLEALANEAYKGIPMTLPPELIDRITAQEIRGRINFASVRSWLLANHGHNPETVSSMLIDFSPKERKVIQVLAQSLDVSETQVVRIALRHYQLAFVNATEEVASDSQGCGEIE